MAREADHIALANKNHDVLFYLIRDPDRFAEWISITAFYKAVQLVDVLCSKAGIKNFGHRDRLNNVKRNYPQIHKHLRVLWSASSIARYLYDHDSRADYHSFADYLAPTDVVEKIVYRRLRPIEHMAISVLSEASKESLLRVPDGPPPAGFPDSSG